MTHALIVDDDTKNLQVLKQALTLENVECTTVRDATRAEAVLASLEQLDVAFLDLEMPGVNGYALLDLIRSYPHLEHVPVVAYTVHSASYARARDAGFHSFISKPMNVDQFPAQLRQILNGTPVWSV